jgi:hypothetical protein
VNDGILVEVVHGSHDAILEFLFGGDTDVAEDGAGELGKKALNEIEPGDQALASAVVVGSLPGRGRSSRAAIGPDVSARSTQRCTV